MKGSRTDRILEEWSAVAGRARRPDAAPRPISMRSGLPAATLTGAAVVIAAVAVAGILLGRPGPNPIAGSTPSAAANRSPAASAPVTAASAPVPTASAPATTGPCDPAVLAARITMWEGAAGQRIAHVELTSRATTDCLVDDLARPQLVAGDGRVLIDGAKPARSTRLVLAPGGTLATLVAAGNYCGPAPTPPVSVAFVLGDGRRFVADPGAPGDATVPPCLGQGQSATIEMHPWAP